MKNYKLLNHTADISIEVWGKTRKELFANAVAAMFDLMIDMSGNEGEKKLEQKTIKTAGNDLEDTLINFLREALYLFNGRGWLVRACQPLELTGKNIVARFQGNTYNRQKNPLKTEIKAVTYHCLNIVRSNRVWQAKLVFDV